MTSNYAYKCVGHGICRLSQQIYDSRCSKRACSQSSFELVLDNRHMRKSKRFCRTTLSDISWNNLDRKEKLHIVKVNTRDWFCAHWRTIRFLSGNSCATRIFINVWHKNTSQGCRLAVTAFVDPSFQILRSRKRFYWMTVPLFPDVFWTIGRGTT